MKQVLLGLALLGFSGVATSAPYIIKSVSRCGSPITIVGRPGYFGCAVEYDVDMVELMQLNDPQFDVPLTAANQGYVLSSISSTGDASMVSTFYFSHLGLHNQSLRERVESGAIPRYLSFSSWASQSIFHPSLIQNQVSISGAAVASNWTFVTKALGEFIPSVPNTCSITSSSGGSLEFDHGTLMVDGSGQSPVRNLPISVDCDSPASIRVSILGSTDLPSNIPGVTSRIAFDGRNYANTYNYTQPFTIQVASTIVWDRSKRPSGSYQASGTVMVEIL